MDRNAYDERCAAILARTRRFDRPAMHFDEVPHDGKAQPEAAEGTRHAAVALRETVEHVRQDIRLDPDAGVGDADFGAVAIGAQTYGHAPSRRRELDGVAHQVPDDLLQA